MSRIIPFLLTLIVCSLPSAPAQTASENELVQPSNTATILDDIYGGRPDLALPSIHDLQQHEPNEPLPYLLEAEARWWQIWCLSAEYKYGMTMARHHEKAPADQLYLELTNKAYTLAENKLHQQNTAEMHLYAAMADALSARLYGIRGEYRAGARAGVRARENFRVALEMDPSLADACTGLGLYNYYVDTLSVLARALRFLMGIPGGSKEQGIQQLERGMDEGQLSRQLARFYLALNLFNYDQRYERSLLVLAPLVERYPFNPVFLLMQGDLNAKLGRNQLAEASYHAADAAASRLPEQDCRAKMQDLARESLASLRHN